MRPPNRGHFPDPKQTPENMSPHCGGTSFRGSVLGPETGPNFGATLWAGPREGLGFDCICLRTVVCVWLRMSSVCFCHPSAVAVDWWRWFLMVMVSASGGRYWVEGSGVQSAGVMAG